MACLKFLALATTLLLAAAAIIVRADFQEDQYKLHKLLEKALLTERNIYTLQQAFYPRDRFTVSEVHFNVTVQVRDIKEEDKYFFQFYNECDCYKQYFQIRVMTNSMSLQTYIEGFMPYLQQFSENSFRYLLSLLSKSQSFYYNYYPTKLLLNLTENPYEIDYNIKISLLALLTRVSYTLNMT